MVSAYPPALEPLAPGAGPLWSVLCFSFSLAAGALLGLGLRVFRSGLQGSLHWSEIEARLQQLGAGPFLDEERFYARLERLVRDLLDPGGAPVHRALAVEELGVRDERGGGLAPAIEVAAAGLGIRFGRRREGEEEARRQLQIVREIAAKLREQEGAP